MSCTWQAESVFRPPCPTEAGDAASLRGVELDPATVGSPAAGAVLQFDGTEYVTVTSLTLPGLFAYGGAGGGPQILTAENSGTFSGTAQHTVLVINPPNGSTIDIAFTLHAATDSLDEVGIFRMYGAFRKVGGTVFAVGDPDATSSKRTSGASTWICDIQPASNRIEVYFTDPDDTGGNYSISAQYSVKEA